MAELRIRGQEVSIRITRGNTPQASITAIKDFTIQLDLAQLDEGYLGETTNRKDDIFNGVSGSFTVHPEGQDILLLNDFIKRRAQRDPSTINQKVNCTARLTFPNGDTPRVLISDMKFGPIPLTVSGRDAYVTNGYTYSAEDAKLITT